MSKWTRCFACLRVRRLPSHRAMASPLHDASVVGARSGSLTAREPSIIIPSSRWSPLRPFGLPFFFGRSEEEGKVYLDLSLKRCFAAENARLPRSDHRRALRALAAIPGRNGVLRRLCITPTPSSLWSSARRGRDPAALRDEVARVPGPLDSGPPLALRSRSRPLGLRAVRSPQLEIAVKSLAQLG